MASNSMPSPSDALIVVDVQNDFCPGGALAVPEGDRVVPVINALMPAFGLTVLTQDWHPAGHSSFASSHEGGRPFETVEMPYGPQVLWPDHCVQGTPGAAFHPDLNVLPAQAIVRKGMNSAIDSYSAFFENDRKTPTGLGGLLSEKGIRRVVLAGLATDFCVFYTAMDARRLGLDVVLLEDACRAIDLEGSLGRALADMAAAGVLVAGASALRSSLR